MVVKFENVGRGKLCWQESMKRGDESEMYKAVKKKPHKELLMVAAPPRPIAKLFTVPESASVLGVSPRLVWRLIAAGAIVAVRVGARSTRIRDTDLEKYLSSLPAAR